MQTITSAEKLAEMMAGKAAITKDVLYNVLKEDEDLNTELAGQYKAFKDQLIHDLEIDEFADIYAETIAYGMFAARLHDNTKQDFTRVEALDLLPKSNPFLRNLFSFVAGPNLEEALRRTIDELAEIFQATDLQKLFANFGSFTQRNDPFIHFYETFLAKYNPSKRKARGVWYTPESVVNFIVRAVDDVLKFEFGLANGLADTSKVSVDWDTGFKKNGKSVIEKRQMHRVQILDPAVGTGTFLAEVIKQISPKVKDVAPGAWHKYVEENLIPRLHGFELLMASYAMCHMKLDMTLTEMGYTPTNQAPRLNVYLTNSLEEGESETQDLFMAQWLSHEANLANDVKNKTPIMCVIGNPPYSVSSSNKSDWIMNLVADYKKDLNERNIQPLSDDYIKFIRFSQEMIEINGEGILGFITNNSYLDGLIHRQMRKTLLEVFDKIYVVDLHGSAMKNEVAPDGSRDVNVFDIMQGVSILIAVKKKESSETKSADHKSKFASVFHTDLWGSRTHKNQSLEIATIQSNNFVKLENTSPNYFLVPKNFEAKDAYLNGFALNEFFCSNACGIVTARDSLLVKIDKHNADKFLSDLNECSPDEIQNMHGPIKDSRDWSLSNAIKDSEFAAVSEVCYRPFDIRYLPYSPNSKGTLSYPRNDIMQHMNARDNIGILVCKQQSTFDFQHVFITKYISDKCTVSLQTKEASYHFPLYVFEDLDHSRRVNFDQELWLLIRDKARHPEHGEPNELQTFDYIYGVLHCPVYRETFKEFLKIDFPRIPFPASTEAFWDISAKGTQLRRLHLMEDAVIGDTPYPFMSDGSSEVGKIKHEGGHVFINETQYFENVPDIAWNFYIGGYQPAQKWLKDRKGRELSFEDIRHFQKIIKILSETDRIMKTIEMKL